MGPAALAREVLALRAEVWTTTRALRDTVRELRGAERELRDAERRRELAEASGDLAGAMASEAQRYAEAMDGALLELVELAGGRPELLERVEAARAQAVAAALAALRAEGARVDLCEATRRAGRALVPKRARAPRAPSTPKGDRATKVA